MTRGAVAKCTSSSSRLALVLGLLAGWLFVQTCGATGTEVFGDEGQYVDLPCNPPYDDTRTVVWQVVQGGTRTLPILIKLPGQDIEIREDRYAGRLSLHNGNNLRISNLNRDDDSVDSTDPDFVGTYRCSQGAGQVGEQYSLRVRRTPEPPTDLAVTAVRLYSVEVEVTGGHDGLEPQSLCVWYRERGTEEWKKGKGENSCQNGVDEGEEITLRSTLPTANTPYQICVVAQNRVNSSRCENAYIQATTDSVASFNATIRLPSEPYKSPDPNHRENQELVSRIINSINTALKPTHPDLEVEVIQFREGSVLADLKMSVGQREVQHVKDDFVSDVRSERLTGIDVDKNFVLIDNEIPPVAQDDTSPKDNSGLLAKVLLPIASLAAIAVIAGVAAYLLCQRTAYFEGANATMEMATAMALQALRELTKDDAKLSILLPTPPATEKPISNVRLPDVGFHESADCKNIVVKAEEAHSLVVSGPTGSGKTQGVLAYAQEFAKKNMNAVMWFFGRSENEEKGLTKETILEQGMELAKKLGEGNLTPEELPNKVMESLQNRQSKSLLIFDDVTATSGIPAAYLATNEKVAVFIVTRSANLDLNLPEYKMEGFADEDVLEYFKSHKKSVEIFKETSYEDLLKLGIHFGNLPHGLTLARSYLLSSRTSVKGYLRQLEERSKGVPGELKEHEKAVYGAIPTSMEDRMSRSSQDMLKFTAILSQDRIPVFILSKALEIASGEEPDKDVFIKEVEELSLARVEGRQEEWIDGRMISVHQQTQAAILCSLDEQERDTMTKSLVKTFLEYFHKDTRKIQDGYINGLLLPHVEVVLKLPTISKLPEEYLSGLARLYETVGYMYCQKRLPEVAAPALDKAKEKISALVPLDTGADNIYQLLVSKGEELYNKEDVYSRSLKKRVLTTGDVEVLKTKIPALSDEFSTAAEMGKPLTENQFKQLVGLQLAYNTEQMRNSFLVELTATVLYTSARRIFYFQGEERVQYRPTAEEDLNLSLEISRKLAEDQGLQILHKMLCQRVGTLYLLKETDGKSPEQQKEDFLQAIAGYQELINDGNDYFENGVLKKIGDDDFHWMMCYRAIVDTYRKLTRLATTDQERADFIRQHDESAEKMVEFGEKQVKKDDKGNVVEEPEMLPEVYNMAGDFLVEMLEKGFVMDQGATATEDGNPLKKARQWYHKALDVRSIKLHHEAVSRLGLAKVYTLMYEAEKSKATQNGTSATNGDTRIPIDATEEKIPLVEKQPTLDEIHHLTNAKGDMNKCLEIYEEKLRNRTKDIQEAKKWNDRIVRHIDSLLTETKEQETTVV
ncbi:uncharacterized protein LOC144907723 isoform X2 [Branchiostoma floridae x Branchiostoma belcheri]